MRAKLCFAVLAAMLSGCKGLDHQEGDLKGIKLEDWPLTDCSTSTKPARDLVAYKLIPAARKRWRRWL